MMLAKLWDVNFFLLHITLLRLHAVSFIALLLPVHTLIEWLSGIISTPVKFDTIGRQFQMFCCYLPLLWPSSQAQRITWSNRFVYLITSNGYSDSTFTEHKLLIFRQSIVMNMPQVEHCQKITIKNSIGRSIIMPVGFALAWLTLNNNVSTCLCSLIENCRNHLLVVLLGARSS